MKENYTLTAEQTEKLKKIFNQGMQRASTALTRMTERSVSVSLVRMELLALEKVPFLLEENKTLVNAVYVHLPEILPGSVLFYLTQESALVLSDLLLRREIGETNGICEIEESALEETGNILTNAYVDILAGVVNLKILSSVPYYKEDLLGAISQSILLEYAREDIYLLLSETHFSLPGTLVKGHFLFFIPQETLEIILNKL